MLNKNSNILVIGDIMLDIYYFGEVNRISPEAPVPVLKKKNERFVLGGASNVAANLLAAGQRVSIMGLIGKDHFGEKIIELLNEIGADSSLVEYWNRPTITKTRFLAENNQQVLRLDVEETEEIRDELVFLLENRLKEFIDQFDMVLISDYLKGLLTERFVQAVIRIANEHDKKVLIDVKDPNYMKYHGAWLLKPNTKELKDLTKMPVSNNEELVFAAKHLREETCCEYVLTTCGSKGMVLVGKNEVYHLDTVGKSVYDVTGAGDTTIAYLTAALADGKDIREAMMIANHAAGIQVGKVGTSSVYLHEVEEAIRNSEKTGKKKIFRINEREELLKQIAEWRNNGDTIVTTNGCFDIIHKGHTTLLREAKSFGDHLIVLLNSDASVKRLKGPERPINSEEDRAVVIASFDSVDAVAIFDPLMDKHLVSEKDLKGINEELKKASEEAPMGIMKLISPDIHVKGGDYSLEQVPEAMFASQFKSVSFVEGYSTTKMIEKSRDNRNNE